MKGQITKQELLGQLTFFLSRQFPHIITDINNPTKKSTFDFSLEHLKDYFILENIESPKKLFHFIKAHQNDLIIIKLDIFSKRKNYWDIIQGAVCSSPDSGRLWMVSYLNEKSFTFHGKIILCTNKSEEEIKSDSKFEYFSRDCHFI